MKKATSLILSGMLLPAGALLAQEAEARHGPLDVEPGLLFWTIVVFGLLLFVLKKTAWPQILAAVEAREQRLEAMIAEAERNRAEAAAALAEHKRLVAEAHGQAQGIIGEAKTAAEKARQAAVEKTRQEQEALLERARREIQAERERAVVELRREAVDLSLAAASKLVGDRLDSEADRKLVTQYLASLERN